MKNLFLPLLLLFLVSLATSCEPEGSGDNKPEPPVVEEIIEIPDEHFKAALVSSNSIDTNGDNVGDSDIDLNDDGEIQRSEGELIEGLILHFDPDKSITYIDLSGIENFVNLKFFKFSGTGDTFSEDPPASERLTYDLTRLKKLEYLEIIRLDTRFIKALDLSGLSSLVEANLYTNSPYYYSSIDGNKNPGNSMDVYMGGCSSLTKLDIHNSFLTIDFCEIPSLKILDMSYLEGGEPEVFDFHCLTELEYLDLHENFIISLVLKNTSVLTTFITRDVYSFRDGHFYPFVQYICIDDIPEEYAQIESLRDNNTVVVTDCTF